MLPIYVMYDSGITEFEEVAILRALQELSGMFPSLNIVCYGSEAWSSGEYSSADWYVQQTRRVVGTQGGIQLDADHLVDLVANEPWQANDPHIDVVLTSHDLTAFDAGNQLNFVFGIADGRVTVQSLARYRGLSDFDRALSIKAVIWHELGHIFGMAANLRRSHTEYNLGPHCTNPGCIMRQGLSVETWAKHARDAYEMQRVYCPECLVDASAVLAVP